MESLGPPKYCIYINCDYYNPAVLKFRHVRGWSTGRLKALSLNVAIQPQDIKNRERYCNYYVYTARMTTCKIKTEHF